jgi:hypothetical protein
MNRAQEDNNIEWWKLISEANFPTNYPRLEKLELKKMGDAVIYSYGKPSYEFYPPFSHCKDRCFPELDMVSRGNL